METVPETLPELGKEKSVEPIDTEQKEINIEVPDPVNEETVAVAPAMVAPTSDVNTESERTDAKTVGSVNAETPESIELTTKPTMNPELEQGKPEEPKIDTQLEQLEIANSVNDETAAIAPAVVAPNPDSSNMAEGKNTDANTGGPFGKETPESVDQTTTKGPRPLMVKEIEPKGQTSNTPAPDSRNIQHPNVTDSSNVNASEDSKKVSGEPGLSVPDNGSDFHVSLIVVGIAVSLVILLALILVTVFLKKRGIRGADLLPC
ncbi:hypothetical protein QAD02_004799 [Eretmocerus hayati]|uniref:Uncharacterized protein n=1 Tax=Eretmocerus hayati TaxID=131215 RepID=A0ACC2NR01_9HYME|nr:hypothetical protein QAD02_004799 [Eretmocerus hayati]